MADKSPAARVAASSIISGGSAGLVAWLWNGFVVAPQMPAEVAAILAGLLGPVVAYLVSWLPRPPASVLAALLLPLVLPACAAFSEQSAAGLTVARVSGVELDAAGREVRRCEIELRDGKERRRTTLSGTVCGQSFHYAADEVDAFRAHEIRADAEKHSAEVLGAVVPEVVDAALTAGLKAFVGTGTVGAARDLAAQKAAAEAARLKIEAMKAAPQ